MADQDFQTIRTPDGMTHRFPKEATPDEINVALGGPKDEGTSTIGKIRNFLGTGSTTTQFDPSKMLNDSGPHMPPTVQNTMTGVSLLDPAIGIARNPEGIINLGKSLYEGARAGLPKVFGGAALAGAGGALESATEGVTGLPHYARYLASYPGIRMAGQGLKEGAQAFGSKFDPASMGDFLKGGFGGSTEVRTSLPTGPSPKWQGKVDSPIESVETPKSLGKVELPSGRKTPSPEERVTRAETKEPVVKTKAELKENESLNIEDDFPEIQRRVRSGEIKEGDPLHKDYLKATEDMQSTTSAAKETRLANHLLKTNTNLSKIPKTSEYLKVLKKESGETNDISLRTLEGAIVKARALKAKL